jgi:ribosomal protein S25
MSGGKSKRKKWSKGKVREKLQNAVMFDQKQYDRMNAEVPKVSEGASPSPLPGGAAACAWARPARRRSRISAPPPPPRRPHPRALRRQTRRAVAFRSAATRCYSAGRSLSHSYKRVSLPPVCPPCPCAAQMKLITIAAVSERIKLGGSLARAGIREMVEKGVLRVVAPHSKMPIYTRATNVEGEK